MLGCRGADGKPAEIVVATDLTDSSVVRVPVRVWTGPDPTGPGWLAGARSLIGRPAPVVTAGRIEWGADLVIGQPNGKIAVLIFAAHWCGHCDVQMPILEQLSRDYVGQEVEFVSVNANAGDGEGIREAVKRWGLAWTWAWIGTSPPFELTA